MKKKSTENFIEESKKIHKNKYDYSKCEYKGAFEKVCIICPEHGEFWQTPHSHLYGRGCPICAKIYDKNYKNTLDYFIQRARKVHNDKYDYSKVEYKNVNTKVCIICPEHGEFWQTPHSHLNTKGCPFCKKTYKGKKIKSNKEEFIEKARKVHGDKYDYSKVNYIDSKTKVCIICPEHGEFWQTPSSHLQNRECPNCSKPLHDLNSFLEISKKIHNNIYDYSKVKYINSQTKVCIICPEHGEFWQMPSNHIRGKGCEKCNRKIFSEKEKLTTNEFIEKARKVHGDKYDYSKVKYINSQTKVCIICPEHGEFWQTPSHHLNGEGCPNCIEYKLEKEIESILKEYKIKYKKEFCPKWNGLSRYDFCLTDNNILIECQGEQHYFPVDFAGRGEEWAKKEYEKNVKNDKIKKYFAELNGYKIIYYTKKKLKKNNEITTKEELINVINDEG